MKCPSCNGRGYDECVAYYYGRMECPECKGAGRICPANDPTCPYQDGDACYYEGVDWPIPMHIADEPAVGNGNELEKI